MENKLKRFLSLVVALVMVFGMLPMGVFAADSAETIQSDLIAWYDFNGVDGTTVTDETGNGNNATLINNAAVIEDTRGSGYVMSLDGGWASNAPGLRLPAAMFRDVEDVTIIMDVKLDSTSRWMCLLNAGVSGQQQKYMTFVNEGYDDNTKDENGNTIGQIGLSNATSQNGGGDDEKRIYASYTNKLPTDGSWGRIALRHVKSTGAAQIYLNNSLVADGFLDVTLQELVTDENCEVRIGSNNVWNDPGLDGLVDNIRIYKRALTEEEMGIIPFNAIDTEEELIEAVAKGGTVELGGNITLTKKLTVTTDTTITGPYTITRGIAGTILAVNKNATLTLDGGIIIDGNNNWTFDSKGFYADLAANRTFDNVSSVTYSTSEEGGLISTAAMITISGTNGAVVMNNATIQNYWATNHNDHAPFDVPAGATLTMNNGTLIQHIKSSVAGQIEGNWIMNGGKITDVHGHSTNGGIVDILGGTFIINGGEFCNITTLGLNANGNGILAQVYGESSKLIINGGNFHDNASFAPGNGWGAFVYLNRGGDFEMNGGIIKDTTTDKCTAFVANAPTSIVLNAGTIEVEKSTKAAFDSLFYGNVIIGKDMVISGEKGASMHFLDDAGNGNSLTIDGTINGTVQLMYATDITGTGTINGDVIITASDYYEFDSMVTIASGNYLGDLIVTESGKLTITGGRFGDLEAIKYLAPGLGLAKNSDGTYTVTDQVAEVNGEVYDSVAAAEEAVAAEGGTIKMLAIAPVKESVIVDQDTVIDLNNNEIYATVEDVYPIFRATADVTVTGEGGVDAMMFGSGYSFIVGSSEAEGTLTIESGKHYATTTVASVTKGTLNIEGGYFEATPYVDENGTDYGHRYTINCIDANYADGSAVVNVTGGEFYGFDPEDNLAEGEGTNFCVELHHSTEIPATVEDRLSTWTVKYDPSVDYVAYNVQDSEYFMDLSDALDVADSGEKVQLLKTWYEELVLVPAGVTFDLNGNVVETKNALSFGVVMDGQENVGGIKIPFKTTEAFTKLQPVNGGYLPLYDDRDGVGMYKFFSYEVQSSKQVGSGSQIIYAARVVFNNNAAYEVLANSGDSGVDFVMNMSWTNVTDFDIRFTMSEGNLKNYAQSAYDQLISEGTNTKAMTLTIKGINKLGSGAFIEATPSVQTVAEVTASSDTMHYNIP